jgi:hypothetical protein
MDQEPAPLLVDYDMWLYYFPSHLYWFFDKATQLPIRPNSKTGAGALVLTVLPAWLACLKTH